MNLAIHPQVSRVVQINQRIRVADALAKPETAHMSATLLHGIRSDIVRLQPHRYGHDIASQAHALVATHFEPLETVRDWRTEINAKLIALALMQRSVK